LLAVYHFSAKTRLKNFRATFLPPARVGAKRFFKNRAAVWKALRLKAKSNECAVYKLFDKKLTGILRLIY
jgi:hypothetical protein